jgi:hypothetical protein
VNDLFEEFSTLLSTEIEGDSDGEKTIYLIVEWYEEPDPDQPPFPRIREQIQEQQAAGKKLPFVVEFVGSEADLKSELDMAEKEFGFEDKIVIITRYKSLKPITKPMPSGSPPVRDLDDLDDPPVIPEVTSTPPPVKEPEKGWELKKPRNVTAMIYGSPLWPFTH